MATRAKGLPEVRPPSREGAPPLGRAQSAAPLDPWSAYLVDAAQRSVLLWDVLRERGNQYLAHMAAQAPNVLHFAAELVLDGRTLARPVNYGLVRIVPPDGIVVDPRKRPFVVVDPRAGHGPGIGGFKADSEIGVALRAGHPCYFIGFLPHPVPGQTIEDVLTAEGTFLERVGELHPEADGKPVVIGNCQAGWAVMMLAATRPELFGPLVVAGAPLSYWAGVHGQNPMRYTGGLLGGSWLTAFAGDLGNGVFDGAHLVQNFESLNPANTLWTKQHDLYAKVDTEGPRYLGFERWWGGHVLLNAEEMQWIVDNLFVGNRLATAEIVTGDGVRIDLRNIASPIVCFCSKGDNITPPQQALGWILDLYGSVDDIRANGQTIVYCVHESTGHLGIFVSGAVAKKEHQELASNIDLIDCLPPGLYEAVLTPLTEGLDPHGLVLGDHIARFEPRTLDDIRALGGNDLEDERAFAAVARLSAVNLGLYRSFVQPWVRATSTEETAEWLRRLHPARMQFEMFSDKNPFMRPVAEMAAWVREHRRPVEADNPFLAAQELASRQIEAALDGYRDWRAGLQEAAFHAFYRNPLLQALLGLRASDVAPRPRPGREPEELAFIQERIAELRAGLAQGGLREATIRATLHVVRAGKGADERAFAVIRKARNEQEQALPLAEFKALIRDQYLMLVLDEEAALEALPRLLRGHEDLAPAAFALVETVVTAAGPLSEAGRERLARIAELFGVGGNVGEQRGSRKE
jgi:pimeloyl-ACP methyl ester carboxylesterase